MYSKSPYVSSLLQILRRDTPLPGGCPGLRNEEKYNVFTTKVLERVVSVEKTLSLFRSLLL